MSIRRIGQRWREIDSELRMLHGLRVVRDTTDPATREHELLEELDALEYEAGLLYSDGENFGSDRWRLAARVPLLSKRTTAERPTYCPS